MTIRDIKRPHYANEERKAKPPNMRNAVVRYAQLGYFVFPLHNPIFDDAGNCTGCTCEEWKRTQPDYGPDFKCPQPGKCPRVNWSQKSTTNLAQIRKWWGSLWRNVDVETGAVIWSEPNIGIDMGKSGKVAFDKDLYKETYAGEAFQDDGDTVRSLTGGGGLHDWYQMPAGKAYGNAKGTLPEGVDVRGAGGYVVAPPSIHKSGKRYEFVAGHSPDDLAPLPLPQFLIDILEAAQTTHATSRAKFTAGDVGAPELGQWDLSDDILNLIHNGAPKGQRSEADYRVILALASAGADDDQIRSVFVYFDIGEKFIEKGANGNKYLGYSIGKARAWVADHPPAPPAAAERLALARIWVRSPACIARLRLFKVCRVADLIPVLDALVEIAQPRRTTRIVATVRDIADRCGLSASTAHRRLTRLVDAGLLTTKLDPYGTMIDLSPLLDLSGTISPNVNPVPVGSTSDEDFFADHRGDDAFTSYPYSYAIKRRQAPTALMKSLGASGLLLWTALLDGGTVNDLAEATGLTAASVRSTLKWYKQAGLLVIWQEGRAKEYLLHPNAWDRLEERREHMATAGMGQLRAARNASDRASFAQRKLQGRMPLEPGQKARLTARRDKADAKAEAHYDVLFGMGINPYTKVRHREPRPHMKFDLGEEWISIHRPIVEAWDDLAPLSHVDRYRMMSYAEYGRAEIDRARHVASRMGRGPRVFVGVDDPGQAVAA